MFELIYVLGSLAWLFGLMNFAAGVLLGAVLTAFAILIGWLIKKLVKPTPVE